MGPHPGPTPEELAELAAWIQLYKQHRALIHAGRIVRIDTPDDTAWMHGVVAADSAAALMSYVQLDEPRTDQPAALRVPGLDPRRRYRVTDVTPGADGRRRESRSKVPGRSPRLMRLFRVIQVIVLLSQDRPRSVIRV
jgi:alpha-galactosidase